MNGVQPCAWRSSPVFSKIFLSNHPMTPGPTTPGLVQITLSLVKLRWCVGQQVRMSVHWLTRGSRNERCGFALPLSGNALADGCSPPLHQSGLGSGLMREVNQVRPRSSIIGLWFSVRPSQYGLSPQYADTPYGFDLTD